MTAELLHRINVVCSAKAIRLLVALIPTKESVFADHIAENGAIKGHPTLRRLLAEEQKVNQRVRRVLTEHKIAYIDVLPHLKRAAATETIYPQNEDGHPNAAGNTVIANAVYDALTEVPMNH